MRKILLGFICICLLYIGGGGIYGGLSFITDPTGKSMGMSPELIKNIIVPNYFIPGIMLLILFGIIPIITTTGLILKHGLPFITPHDNKPKHNWVWHSAYLLSMALVLWILFQLLLIGYGHQLQVMLLGVGVIMFIILRNSEVKEYFGEINT
ncbi:MAG: hypothetical protein EPN82_01765 [Bacteroidetes bacterium]|nr:MAG: hypothetical protein EPN82_01765 [Bacteroidota bacterium]